jgi:hypothetical protein
MEDIGAYLSTFSSEAWYRLIGDANLFYFVPFVAGFLKMEIHKQYVDDKTTYDYAEIKETQLYADAFKMFKVKWYSIFGR